MNCSKCGESNWVERMQCQHGTLHLTILECTTCGQVVFAITPHAEQEEPHAD